MAKPIYGSSNSKLLAVFWYVDGQFVGPEDTLQGSSVIQYGDYLQLDYDHFAVWEDYNPTAYDVEYDYYPRGRVLFNIKIHKFVVICDEKIAGNPSIRDQLLSFYGLPITTIFETDEHYQSEV